MVQLSVALFTGQTADILLLLFSKCGVVCTQSEKTLLVHLVHNIFDYMYIFIISHMT